MPASPSSGVLRTAAVSVLFLALLPLAACGDDPTGSGDGVEGTWEFSDIDGQHYYVIRDSSFTSYHQSLLGADCFTSREWDIIEIDGSDYRIRDVENPGIEITIEIERDGDDLLLLGTSLDRSSVDEDDLDECTGSVCEGLQALTADDFVGGALTGTDELDGGGRRYDAYAVTGIDNVLTFYVQSEEINGYVRVLDEEGNLLAENDDQNESTLNAAVEYDVDADSCYVIVVTTAGADDLGTYILNVEPAF